MCLGKKYADPQPVNFFLFDDILVCSDEVGKKASEKEYSAPLKYIWIDETTSIACKI